MAEPVESIAADSAVVVVEQKMKAGTERRRMKKPDEESDFVAELVSQCKRSCCSMKCSK